MLCVKDGSGGQFLDELFWRLVSGTTVSNNFARGPVFPASPVNPFALVAVEILLLDGGHRQIGARGRDHSHAVSDVPF